MDNFFSKAEALAGNLKEYVNTRIDSLKLNAAEKGSKIVANGVAGVFVGVFALFFIGLGGIALSLVLGEWMGRIWAGFLAVACFYLLIGIIIWVAREKLVRKHVMNAIIQQLFREDEENK